MKERKVRVVRTVNFRLSLDLSAGSFGLFHYVSSVVLSGSRDRRICNRRFWCLSCRFLTASLVEQSLPCLAPLAMSACSHTDTVKTVLLALMLIKVSKRAQTIMANLTRYLFNPGRGLYCRPS